MEVPGTFRGWKPGRSQFRDLEGAIRAPTGRRPWRWTTARWRSGIHGLRRGSGGRARVVSSLTCSAAEPELLLGVVDSNAGGHGCKGFLASLAATPPLTPATSGIALVPYHRKGRFRRVVPGRAAGPCLASCPARVRNADSLLRGISGMGSPGPTGR